MNIYKIIYISILTLIYSCDSESLKDHDLINQWNTELSRLTTEVELLEDDLSKSNYLRAYCGRIMAYGPLQEEAKIYFNQQKWDSISVAKVYNTFITDSLIGYCDPISEFYCYLLNHFEIPCSTYGYGITLELSHVLALVEINTIHGKKVIVQDPHYALLYVNEDGTPLEFSKLVELIQLNQFEKIHLQTDSLEARMFLAYETISFLQKEIAGDTCKVLLEQLIGHSYRKEDTIVNSIRNYEFMINNQCNSVKDNIESYLASKGYPPNVHYNFLFKRHVDGPDKSYFEPKINHILGESNPVNK